MAKPKASHHYEQSLIGLANNLRKMATPGEKKLWQEFQKLRLSMGVRFRRQQPIGKYIADFYCAKYRCVVEIDGISHDTKIEQDNDRDVYMKGLGLHILRFTQGEVLQDVEAIMNTIIASLNVPTPPLTPPSRGGE
ncbi:MAG: endonuclease domain-containing protein [Alphaproteobacteria bacterium]|nr:endonuclease domain-containing protein [Alphaproteobacteria bacterium]